MPERLCEPCKDKGRSTCEFDMLATDAALRVPPVEKQTPLNPYTKISREVAATQNLILLLRNAAIQKGCPKAETINPSYPGS